jgi:hypothetical protein
MGESEKHLVPIEIIHEAGVSDLRNGPVVLGVPAKTAKAVIYGQVVDAWQVTIAEVGPDWRG